MKVQLSKSAAQLIEVVKSGNIPTDFAIGGTLAPDEARAFYSLVIDQSEFLKKISTLYGKKLTIPIKVTSLGSRVMVRVAEGSEPTSGQKAQSSQEGKNMLLLPMQIFYDLPFQAIEDNMDDPQFESKIANELAILFGNELLDLGTNGTDDDYTDSAWVELNKGWVHLAKNASNSAKVNTNGDTDLLVSLKKLVAAMPNKFKGPQAEVILSPADVETYLHLIGAKTGGVQYLISGAVDTYLGKKISVNPFLTAGTYLYGNPKDLVMGLNLGIKKYRNVNTRKRCIEYTYDISADFELARDRAITIAWDQGA